MQPLHTSNLNLTYFVLSSLGGRSSFLRDQLSPLDLTSPAMVTKMTTTMFRQVKMLLNLKIKKKEITKRLKFNNTIIKGNDSINTFSLEFDFTVEMTN